MRYHLTFAAFLSTCALSLMLCVPASGQVNLLTNSGFELPPDPTNQVDNTVTDWTLLLDTSRATFYNHTAGGSWSLWLKSFEAAGGGATQTVPIVTGQTYTLTADMLFEPSYPNIPGIDSFLSLQFQDASGTNVGDAFVNHIDPASVTANKTWSPFSITGTAPAGATQVLAEIGWANGSTVTGQQSAFADDASLVQGGAIPEPAGVGLIALGGIGLLARRRTAKTA